MSLCYQLTFFVPGCQEWNVDVVLCCCRSYVELFKVHYRCPLNQAVQVAVQMRSKNVQVERIDVALQSVTDLLDPEIQSQIQGRK